MNVKQIPKGVFLALFFVSVVVSSVALRHNNTTMAKLREAVYAADKNGNDVNAALNNLRSYVYAHMNTNLDAGTNIRPPIQLKYTYERLQAAAQAEADAANSQLYTDAQNYCQAQIPANLSISGRLRVPCVTDYVTSHGGASPKAVPASLYQFDFVSPAWSPDFAGWSLVVTGLLLVGFLLSLLLERLANRGKIT